MKTIVAVIGALGLVATTITTHSQDLQRVRGADLIVDLQEYACREVILMDGLVFNISNHEGNRSGQMTSVHIDD